MAPAEAFGRRVKQMRTALTLSQIELAKRAGMSRTYLARVELGQQEPTLGTIEKLAKALHVTVGDLLGGQAGLHWLAGLLHARVARVGSTERTAFLEVRCQDAQTWQHAHTVLASFIRPGAVGEMASPAGALWIAGDHAGIVIRALLDLPAGALTSALRKSIAAALEKQRKGGTST
jgi:transcriptional regulator with XRE-family HTH domain